MNRKIKIIENRNPFITSLPVRGDDFFGREKLINDIETFLSNKNEFILIIHGQRRIGKTSLLFKIHDDMNNNNNQGGGNAIFFDLQNKANEPLHTILWEIALNINNNLATPLDLNKNYLTEGNAREYFKKQFLPEVFNIIQADSPLILLFDEFDSLFDLENQKEKLHSAQAVCNAFIPYLADIKEKTYPFKCILAIGRNYRDLDLSQYAQILKFGELLELDYFAYEELKELIEKLSSSVLPFEKSAIDSLYTITSGHPYFSQCLASSAFDEAYEKKLKKISPDILKDQIEPGIKRFGGGLIWLWDSFGARDKIILYLMARVEDKHKHMTKDLIYKEASQLNMMPAIQDNLSQVIAKLLNVKIIKENKKLKGGFTFYVKFFQEWIFKENSPETIGKLLDKANPEVILFLKNAQFYFYEGDYERAIPFLKEVINRIPLHFEALFLLGFCYERLSKKDKTHIETSLMYFKLTYQINPTEAKEKYLEVLKIQLKLLNKHSKKRVLVLKEIWNINPNDIITLKNLLKECILFNVSFKDISNLDLIKELDLNGLSLKKVPDDIFLLNNLKKLYLANNNIKEIPIELLELDGLQYIDLSNNKIINIQESFFNSELKIIWEKYSKVTKGINVFGNPLKHPPPEIIQKGVKPAKKYFPTYYRKDIASIITIILLTIGLPSTIIAFLRDSIISNIPLTIILIICFEIIIFLGGLLIRIYKSRFENRLLDWMYDNLTTFFTQQKKQYFKELQNRYWYFDVKGLSTQGPYHLNLQEMFVELKLTPMPIQNVSSNLISKFPYELNKASLPIWDFFKNPELSKQNLAIIGAPGSGKTALAQQIILILSGKSRIRRRLKIRSYIPIPLFVRDISKTIQDSPAITLGLLTENYFIKRHFKLYPGWLEKQLSKGKCIILLDGVDEVSNPELRKQVAHWIEEQMIYYYNSRFIISARPAGYRTNPVAGVTVLTIRHFNHEQVKLFIQNWYLSNEKMSSESNIKRAILIARECAEDLLMRINNNPALTDLSTNPLLLTIIATVHRYKSTLPGRRVELFKEIFEVMLGRRQQSKGIEDSLTPAQKQFVLEPLAYYMMIEQVYELSSTEITKTIQSTLKGINPDISVNEFIKIIEHGSGLFIQKEENVYSFSHRIFQEFLASVFIREKQLVKELENRVTDPWWHETIRLYAANNDASPIIEACLNKVDLNPSLLKLAQECIEIAKMVNKETRKKFVTLLAKSTDKYIPEKQRIID